MNFLKLSCCLIAIIFLAQFSYGEWPDRFGGAKQVNLKDLLEKPESWLNIPVQIPVRFAWLSEVYVPFRSHFSQDYYLNFTAWDIQEPIWEAKGFNQPHIYFYVEKDNPELKSFLKLKTFDTVCLLGKIEGLFAKKPFFRIVWCCRLPGNLNENNLKMINNSLKLYRQRRFEEALPIFQKILETEPPQDIEAMLRKAIAQVCMNEWQKYEFAFVELKKAEEAAPEDEEVKSLLKECILNLGSRAELLQEKWQDGMLKNTVTPTNSSGPATINLNPELEGTKLQQPEPVSQPVEPSNQQ